ncbi:hypothetical protein [Psychrobacillus sp. BM2]|uniref:hypothetical protein n=1 Tax=Psychrobacillus sp. BM2 TaxID=3400421 RepID=UPI003B02825A
MDDCYLIDTNFFLWLAYSRLSLLEEKYQQYQIDEYPIYLENAINNGSKLKYSRLSFGEISQFIEKCEHEIYCLNNNSNVYFKSFRRNFPRERPNVVTEIKNSFSIIKGVSEGLIEELDDLILSLLENDLENNYLDGADSFIASFAKRNGIDKIIFDDADFASIEEVYLFTANERIIRESRRQGKLLNR